MKEVSKWVDAPTTSEQYIRAFRQIEQLHDSEHPYRHLLRVLHAAPTGMTIRELASELLPDRGLGLTGKQIAPKINWKLKPLGELLLSAFGAKKPPNVQPPVSGNTEYSWAAFAWWDDDLSKWGLLPQAAEALEVLSWVTKGNVEPSATEIEVLREERSKRLQAIWLRRGQKEFRNCLMAAYGRRCAVTTCDALEALEAAHITPYAASQSYEIPNGLLLRADVHTLFDLDLIGIHPDSLTISLSPSLLKSSYQELHGKPLSVPEDDAMRPSRAHLAQRWLSFLEKCSAHGHNEGPCALNES